MHYTHQKTNVVVFSKDTDVLVLMVFAYAISKINEVMKIESRKSFNIRKIVEFLGTYVAANIT